MSRPSDMARKFVTEWLWGARNRETKSQSWLDEYTRDSARMLDAYVSSPHTDDFIEAVKVEAVHQRELYPSEHDEGKEPQDWFWLLAYLSGKALAAAIKGDKTKALHHTISSAAALLNWHAHMTGAHTAMRPGTR